MIVSPWKLHRRLPLFPLEVNHGFRRFERGRKREICSGAGAVAFTVALPFAVGAPGLRGGGLLRAWWYQQRARICMSTCANATVCVEQVLRHYACQLTISAGKHVVVSKPLSSFEGNVFPVPRGICFGLPPVLAEPRGASEGHVTTYATPSVFPKTARPARGAAGAIWPSVSHSTVWLSISPNSVSDARLPAPYRHAARTLGWMRVSLHHGATPHSLFVRCASLSTVPQRRTHRGMPRRRR